MDLPGHLGEQGACFAPPQSRKPAEEGGESSPRQPAEPAEGRQGWCIGHEILHLRIDAE